MSTARTTAVIELHFADGRRVKVVPSDKNLLVLSVNEAVEACRAYDRQIQFKDQFDLLLDKLAAWIRPRQAQIKDAYVTARDAGLLFLVVLSSGAYDEPLEDDLTELDLEIANDGDLDLIPLSVLAIPNSPAETVESFLSHKVQLRFVFHGDGT